MAWLNATPVSDKGVPDKKTRREQLKGNPLEKMPDLEYGHLFKWFMDFGPCNYTESGPLPVSYQDIAAWSQVTGIKLIEDEGEILRNLSLEYCMMAQQAKSKSCPPPFVSNCFDDDELSRTRANVTEQMKRFFKRLG